MLNDNAGLDVIRVDKSQSTTTSVPAFNVGAAVAAQRGFINTPQLVSNYRAYLRIFGVPDTRRYGTSGLHCKMILDASNSMWISRAGKPDWTLSDIVFNYSNPANNAVYGAAVNINRKVMSGATAPSTDPTYASPSFTSNNTLVGPDNDGNYTWNEDTITFSGITLSATDITNLTAIIKEINGNWRNDRHFVYGTNTNIVYAVRSIIEKDIPIDTSVSYPAFSFVFDRIINNITKALSPNGVAKIVTEQDNGSMTGNQTLRIFSKGEGYWTLDKVNSVKDAGGNWDLATAVPRLVIKGVPLYANESYSTDPVVNARLSHIEVYYDGQLVENHLVSRNMGDVDQYGSNIYFVSVLQNSDYIQAADNELNNIDVNLPILFPETGLIGGFDEDYDPLNKPMFATAVKSISNYPDQYDVFIMINAGNEMKASEFGSQDVLEGNQENALFIDSTRDWNDAKMDPQRLANLRNSGYSVASWQYAFYYQWVKTTNSLTGNPIRISVIPYIAMIYGNLYRNNQLGYAPAGYNRAALSGIEAISRDLDGPERIILTAQAQFNPLKLDGSTIVVWDQLTSQKFKSAFSNLHVSASFLYIKRLLILNFKTMPFEFNDAVTVGSMLNRLEVIKNSLLGNNYAEEIAIDDDDNIIGSEEILINFNWRPKGVAKFIRISIIARPSDQTLAVSMAND